MVNGFQEETHELTKYELETLLPAMVKGLSGKIGIEKIITSSEAIKGLKANGYKINPARWRKIVNHIRVNNIINFLVSSSKGYYIATKKEEIIQYIESLDQRANAIITVRDALDYQLKKAIKLTQKSINNE